MNKLLEAILPNIVSKFGPKALKKYGIEGKIQIVDSKFTDETGELTLRVQFKPMSLVKLIDELTDKIDI